MTIGSNETLEPYGSTSVSADNKSITEYRENEHAGNAR